MRAPAAKSRRETVELFISPSAASRRAAAGERISGRLRPPAPRQQGRIAQLAEQPRGNQSAGVSVVRVHVRPPHEPLINNNMKLIGLIKKAWRKLLRKKDYGVEVVRLPDGGSYIRATHSLISVGDVSTFGEDSVVEKLQTPAIGANEANYRQWSGEYWI